MEGHQLLHSEPTVLYPKALICTQIRLSSKKTKAVSWKNFNGLQLVDDVCPVHGSDES
jgi:hypothetical protein